MACKQFVIKFARCIITISCLIFVLYQAQKCVRKYLGSPRSTDVSIELASRHPYPQITFCYREGHGNGLYSQNLKRCNLTYNEYFINNLNWYGNCNDGHEVFENMVGSPKDYFDWIVIASGDDVFMIDKENETSFHFIDNFRHGRCFTLNYPEDQIDEVTFGLQNYKFDIYIHNPGNFFEKDSDYKSLQMNGKYSITTTVTHEIFDVLDFDGDLCRRYQFDRDDCIYSLIEKNTIEQLGCTSPFGRNKSNVCTDSDKSEKAFKLYEKYVAKNITETEKHCPESCVYQMITFGAFTKEEEPYSNNILNIRFQRFIKVSKSRYSYTLLELIAEFGGYVGLFLGLSVVQLSVIFERAFKTMNFEAF